MNETLCRVFSEDKPDYRVYLAVRTGEECVYYTTSRDNQYHLEFLEEDPEIKSTEEEDIHILDQLAQAIKNDGLVDNIDDDLQYCWDTAWTPLTSLLTTSLGLERPPKGIKLKSFPSKLRSL